MEGRKIVFGYARVSRKEQNLDRQLEAIRRYRDDIDPLDIYTDKSTGKVFTRDGYDALKVSLERCSKVLGEGSVELVVEELDRLGRNYAGIKEELKWFKEHGIILRILEIPTTLSVVDSSNQWVMDLITNILIEVYASMAEQELEKRSKRQMEGIEQAHKRGVKFGRPSIKVEREKFCSVADLAVNGGITHKKAMEALGLKDYVYWKHIGKWYPAYEKRHSGIPHK